MSKLRLDEIGIGGKQRKLYAEYFDELHKVKTVLTIISGSGISIEQQIELVNEYKAAWALFKQDKNFTADDWTICSAFIPA